MEKEPTRVDSEPMMAPFTDFVVKNVDDYSTLNPENKFLRDLNFELALRKALEQAKDFDSPEDKRIPCTYYVVHMEAKIDGEPIGFVIKALHREREDKFDEIIGEYETLKQYCPTVTLPTIFMTASAAGSRERNLSLQRRVDNGMPLAEYVNHLKSRGEKMPEQIKTQIREMVAGLREMHEKEGIIVDLKTVNPTEANCLVDAKNQHFWIVDNNHLFKSQDKITSQRYLDKIAALEYYLGEDYYR